MLERYKSSRTESMQQIAFSSFNNLCIVSNASAWFDLRKANPNYSNGQLTLADGEIEST